MLNRPLLIANWKMAVSATTAEQLIKITHRHRQDPLDLVICPSAPLIPAVHNIQITTGAQTWHFQEEAKMTGEISAAFLVALGVRYVLAGHSERRVIFGETNARIHSQCQGILAQRMTPVLCVGETHEEREAGKAEEVINVQLQEALEGLSDIPSMLVAYEPVWAIGGSGAMEIADAGEMLTRLRERIQAIRPNDHRAIEVLYGGSVDAKNVPAMLGAGIQGFLVGTASQHPDSWEALIRAAMTTHLPS